MKPGFLLPCGSAALAGCVPRVIFYEEGSRVPALYFLVPALFSGTQILFGVRFLISPRFPVPILSVRATGFHNRRQWFCEAVVAVLTRASVFPVAAFAET